MQQVYVMDVRVMPTSLWSSYTMGEAGSVASKSRVFTLLYIFLPQIGRNHFLREFPHFPHVLFVP